MVNPFSEVIPAGPLLIRADASVAIGTGHVMRMIALAQAWQRRRGTVTLAAQVFPASLAERLSQEQIRLYRLPDCQIGSRNDAIATRRLANELGAHGLVVDGYQFAGDYQAQVRDNDYSLLVVDDYGHSDRYFCDFILNQNLGAVPSAYAASEPDTKVLVGPGFALLRNEFLVLRDAGITARDAADQTLRLLVTLGGSDEGNVTGLVLSAIATIIDIPLSVRVLVGSSNPHADHLLTQATKLPHVSVWQNVSDMASQYRWADFAIAAGGSTNWEMCFFGLPRILVVLADNQRGVAAALAAEGSACNLGDAAELTIDEVVAAIRHLATEPQTRELLAQKSRDLVDGWGAARVVDEVLAVNRSNGSSIPDRQLLTLRSARLADSSLLLSWRNDPATRQSSRQQNLVDPSDHERWLVATIEGTGRRLFIAESAGHPIGTVRLDYGETVEISWTIAPAARGRGWGHRLVQQIVDQADCELIAGVRPDNVSSQKIACAAGFELLHGTAELLTYRRPAKKACQQP